MLKHYLILLLFFTNAILFSQKTFNISIIDTIANPSTKIIFKSQDSLEIKKKVRYIVDSLSDYGFLAPKIFYEYNDSTIAIKKGIQYKWAKINIDKNCKDIFENAGFNPEKWEKQYISPVKIKGLSELLLKYLENTGYPFANIKFDSIRFVGLDSIIASLNIVKYKKIYFDSIKVISKVDISPIYLENYLGIHKGEVFDKSKFDNIQKKLDNLPFIKLNNPPFISFFGNKATLNIDIKPAKINRFDLLLGLIPDKTGIRKYKLTGEVTAQMINKLGRGENLFFKYKNLALGKQNLNLEVNYPYFLNMPFGLDTKLGIYIFEESRWTVQR